MITHAKLVLLSVSFLMVVSLLHSASIADPAPARAAVMAQMRAPASPVRALTGLSFRSLTSGY